MLYHEVTGMRWLKIRDGEKFGSGNGAKSFVTACVMSEAVILFVIYSYNRLIIFNSSRKKIEQKVHTGGGSNG